MKLTKREIMSLFESKGATKSELDRKSVIFLSSIFQDRLLSVSGVITDINSFDQASLENQLSLKSLSDLDVFDLEDFIHSNEISTPQANSVTPAQLDCLSDGARKIILDAKGHESNREKEIWFSLVEVVQTGLPITPVAGEQYFERSNGDLTVTFSAPSELKLPHGPMARKLFIWLVSEAVKTKGDKVNLGKSLKSFVTNTLGATWTTGKNGNRDQWMECLASMLGMSITATRKGRLAKGNKIDIANLTISKRASLWWSPDFDDGMDAIIEFNDGFIEAVKTNAVPGDALAMQGILKEGGCLAFDIYSWFTYRYYKLDASGQQSVSISIYDLWKQSGSSASSFWTYKRAFLKSLNIISKWYRQANYKVVENTLILHRSTPHISSVLASTKLKKMSEASVKE
tara:strand:- start:22959 stop:24161 length:1203 start_codon:yes stop_codon:yes gene_type:complete